MGVGKPLDLPPPRAIAHTPPQSHRIRASDVLTPEPASSRKWLAPLLVVLVVGGASGAFFVRKHRAVAQARAAAARVATESAEPAGSASSRSDTPSSPPTGVAAAEPAPPASTEAKGGSVPAYGSSTPASLAVRGGVKAEPAASSEAPAPPATSASSAFGVLAVPEVPKIEGAAAGSSNAPTTAPAVSGAASATPAPPDPFAHARVTLGSVHAEKVAASDVLAALPSARFNRCYKTGLAAKGSNVAGQGSLRLTIDSVGHIGGASFAGTAELASIGQCIAEAAVGADVKHVESGVTGAEIDLHFQPE
jgi:hypothetical protein